VPSPTDKKDCLRQRHLSFLQFDRNELWERPREEVGRTLVGIVVCIWCHLYLLSLVLCGWCCGCWSRYSLPRGAKRRMGNQVARVGNASHRKVESAPAASTGNGNHGVNVTASSTTPVISKSEPDHHNSHTQFFPIENLAKVQWSA